MGRVSFLRPVPRHVLATARSTTSLTLPIACRPDVRIGLTEDVTMFAPIPVSVSAGGVFLGCHRLQMRGVDTTTMLAHRTPRAVGIGSVTKMVEFHAAGDGAHKAFVDSTMRLLRFSDSVGPTVPITINESEPLPAPTGGDSPSVLPDTATVSAHIAIVLPLGDSERGAGLRRNRRQSSASAHAQSGRVGRRARFSTCRILVRHRVLSGVSPRTLARRVGTLLPSNYTPYQMGGDA